jgi:hypothetical protein
VLCARDRPLPGVLSAARGEGAGPLGRVLGSRPARWGAMMTTAASPVLEVSNLKKHFPEVVRTEILIEGAVLKHVPDGGQHRGGHGTELER